MAMRRCSVLCAAGRKLISSWRVPAGARPTLPMRTTRIRARDGMPRNATSIEAPSAVVPRMSRVPEPRRITRPLRTVAPRSTLMVLSRPHTGMRMVRMVARPRVMR